MEDIEYYLFQLRCEGIDIKLKDNELKLISPKKKPDLTKLNEIRSKKETLLQHLSTKTKQYYPLSSLQKRMCDAYFSFQSGYTHNISSSVTLIDGINVPKLKSAYSALIENYEILRTGYEKNNVTYYQVIWPEIPDRF